MRTAGALNAQMILSDAGLDGAWALFIGEIPEGRQPFEETTIRDIVGKLVRYGSVSEKQTNFVHSLLAKIPQRAQIAAERATERDAASDAPEGKQVVTGEVLKAEYRESQYGEQYKMLVKSAAGWLVWSTVPAALGTVKRGDVVTFQATLERSKDDAKFCFAKRPTVPNALRVVSTTEGGQ